MKIKIILSLMLSSLCASNSSKFSISSSVTPVTPPLFGSLAAIIPLSDPLVELISLEDGIDINLIPYSELNYDMSMSEEEIIEKIGLAQDWYNRIFSLVGILSESDRTEAFFRLDKILFNLHDRLEKMKGTNE